jgi:amino acid adenylation domain-containing protein
VIGYDTATDGGQFGDYCARHPIDVLKIVPAHFQSLLATAEDAEVLPRRLLVLGGDVLSHGFADQVMSSGRCRLLNHYGPTETTIGCLTFPLDPHRAAGMLSATVPIGRPIDNAEAYILNERLDPVPVGVPGELYLGGAGLARGYLGRPDLTAQRFVPHPLASEPGSRLYKTGDLARALPDGTVEFLGRTDFQIKLRGYRIELGEIESRLTEHTGVQQAVVTARANQSGERYLAAYIVPRDTAGEPAGWREFLKERLPDYMIPSALVCLPALPLNQNGKVDRALLPDPEAWLASSRRYVAPRNPEEEMLAGIWAIILKRDRIGIHDNFFDLGGHSLLATQVMARVRSVFHVELPLRTIFEATTVAELAEAVVTAKKGEHDADHAPPPIVPTVRKGPVPLSFAQQRLWVLAQLDPESVAYNIPIALRVRGRLDLDALQNSFHAVIRRHEALRTVFQTFAGVPMQVIAESLDLSVPLIDLRHLASEAREEAAARLAAVEAQRPFDLRYGPLLRVNIIRIDESEHVLLLTLHHIVSDAWSAQVLVREVTLLYAAFVAGEQSSLPDLPLQYADFSQWQHAWMSDAVLERELAYWKISLGGDLPILDLLTDRSRPALQSSRGALLTRLMSLDISNQVVELSRRTGATLYMTLLTGFVLLLHRWTGQRDLIVGTPIANRTHNELESLIGFFVNTLAIRIQVPIGATVADMLGRVRATCLDAYSHQDMPFEKLVEVLQPKRDIGRSPIFQVMFDLQNAPAAELNVPGLDFVPLEIDNTTTKFDLSMTVQETEMGLSFSIEYNRDLFEETTIMSMLAQYEHLLKGMAAEPDGEVSRVHLMSQENRERVLSGGRSEPLTDHVGSIHEMIERQVQRSPDVPAIRWQNRTFSYREVNAKANQLARYLRGRGIGPEQRVGICMERCPEMIMTLLGILKAGGTYVPLDPAYPSDRQINLGRDAGLSLVVTHGSCMENREAYPFTILPYERIQDVTQALSQDNLGLMVAPHQAAYIIYTSGSTGKPKGVVISHQAVSRHVMAAAAQYGIQASDRILQFASLSFDVAAEELLCAFFQGATIVLQPCRLFETIPAFLDFLRRECVSVVGLPASYWQLWMAEADEPGRDVPDHLRVLIVGNEAVSAEHLAIWKKKAAERVRWLNAYGPTEATITTTTYETDRADTPTGAGIVPIGKPLAGRSVYVLDEMLEPVPYGVPGELCIGGASLARGYLHDPIQTGTSFLPDPFCDNPGSRLYRTGDRVRLRHDNVIEFLGRLDDQVKVRGFRVEPGEIEAALSRHPDVQEAAVLVRRHPEGRDMLVAYVQLRSERNVETALLRQWVGSSLPEHMVPSVVVFLPRIPRTGGGKIDRHALPMPEWSNVSRQTYMAPHTPLQKMLADIWCNVLAVEKVGIHDNFFDLGGHSLLAVQLMSDVQKVIETPLSLMDLFQSPTVACLAASIENGRRDNEPGTVCLRSGGFLAPLFCFDPTGTHAQAYKPLAVSLENDRPVWALSLSHIFSGKWQDLSIEVLAERHVRLMRERQPEGPYHLVGWSNGGVLAFAAARQLEQQGEQVAFLGLLDTQPDTAVYEKDPTPVDELLAYIGRGRQEAFNAIPEKARDEFREQLEGLSEDEKLEYAIRWAQERDFLSVEEADASIGSLKIGYALARAAALFMSSVRSRPVHSPIHAWWTTNTIARHGSAPMDWSLYTTGAVSVETVVGDHMDAVQSIQIHQQIGEILSGLERVPLGR